MAGKPKDYTGQKINRLTALSLVRMENQKAIWLYQCDCGNTTETRANNVRSGKTASCGCIKREHLETIRERKLKRIPGYSGAHTRIRLHKGNASDHPCVDCGQKAYGWSYDKQAEIEYKTTWKTGSGTTLEVTYSLDPDHYHARCSKCHYVYDSKA